MIENNSIEPKPIENQHIGNSVEEGNEISQLVELMRSVDIDSPESKLNATTINDGKGGRILL